MEACRAIVAIIFFTSSSYLVYDLFANGFSAVELVFCILGYGLAHYIWPKNSNTENPAWELLDLIVELPFNSVALLVRGLGKLLHFTDGF